MERAKITEILDSEEVPEELAARAYNDLARIHWWLGDTYSVIRAIRNDPKPVRRILDIGCANGTVAESVRRKLSVEVIGVDLKPPVSTFKDYGVPILRADAVRDRLPNADVAFCMHLCHHLSESDLIGLIRNVGRFCRRFILLDLVRHRAPLALFRLFVAPFVCRIVVVDGARSIRRSYTTAELRKLTNTALAGSGSVFTQSVAPFYAHQIIDIAYG
jgi:2-polyprenyl-3-methyl-5-hydroxy-6-metoxy-1,4-benzoquinol methylase